MVLRSEFGQTGRAGVTISYLGWHSQWPWHEGIAMSDDVLTEVLPTGEDHDRMNAEVGFRFVRAIAVEKAALDRELTPVAIRVLAVICYFMNNTVRRAWPGYAMISEVSGYSQSSIESAVRELKSRGYLFSERRAPITGGRALVHYGLCSIGPADIDAQINVYLANWNRKRAHYPENCGVGLTLGEIQGSASDPANFNASDPPISLTQKPLLKEPKDRGIDQHRRDFAVMFFGWGSDKPPIITEAMQAKAREALDRALLTLKPGALRSDIAERALAATISDLATRTAKAKGSTAFMSLFRTVLNHQAGALAIGDANVEASARVAQSQAEMRASGLPRFSQRKPSAHDLAAQAVAELQERGGI